MRGIITCAIALGLMMTGCVMEAVEADETDVTQEDGVVVEWSGDEEQRDPGGLRPASLDEGYCPNWPDDEDPKDDPESPGKPGLNPGGKPNVSPPEQVRRPGRRQVVARAHVPHPVAHRRRGPGVGVHTGKRETCCGRKSKQMQQVPPLTPILAKYDLLPPRRRKRPVGFQPVGAGRRRTREPSRHELALPLRPRRRRLAGARRS